MAVRSEYLDVDAMTMGEVDELWTGCHLSRL